MWRFHPGLLRKCRPWLCVCSVQADAHEALRGSWRWAGDRSRRLRRAQPSVWGQLGGGLCLLWTRSPGGGASPPLRDLPACGDALAERPDGRLTALPGGERRALTVVGCGHVFCVLVLFSLEMGCQKGEGRAQGRMHPGKRVHLGASGSHTCVCRARCDSTTFKSSMRVAGAGCLPPPHSLDSARVLLRASLSSLIQWLLR